MISPDRQTITQRVRQRQSRGTRAKVGKPEYTRSSRKNNAGMLDNLRRTGKEGGGDRLRKHTGGETMRQVKHIRAGDHTGGRTQGREVADLEQRQHCEKQNNIQEAQNRN